MLAFCRISGDVDHRLQVVVPDIAACDRVCPRLVSDTQLPDLSSSFAMEKLKCTTALPLADID